MKKLIINILFFILFTYLYNNNTFENIVLNNLKYLSKDFNNLNSLQHFCDIFGEPKTILQIDDAETFFYWDELGFAVFCHPLLYSQYDKERKNWEITSIIIPLEYEIKFNILNTKKQSTIIFKKLILNKNLFSLPSFFWGKNINLINNKINYIELKKRDWFFSYD